jgi:hypothetical protein
MQGDGLAGVPFALSAFQRAQGRACQEAGRYPCGYMTRNAAEALREGSASPVHSQAY